MTYSEALKYFFQWDEQTLRTMAKITLSENSEEITEEAIQLTIIQGAETKKYGDVRNN